MEETVPATLKDVAERAGVSVSTVSRVLNNDKRITPPTRERVMAVVESLNYKVNAVARSLKLNRTRIVGFVTPEIANDFFMMVAQGVEARLQDLGYNMIVCNAAESETVERSRLDLLIQQCVDGVILAPSGPEGHHLSALAAANIPLVLVDRLVRGVQCDAVLVDNAGGTRAAVARLLERGFRRLGFIGGNPAFTNARERQEGFRRALEEAGLSAEPRFVAQGDFHVAGGYAAMRRLLAGDSLPEVVFVANYYMQIGAAKYLLESGLTGQVYLAGFDDMELTSVTGIAALTIRQPVLEIGRRSASMLVDRIEGRETGAARIVRLKTEIVERD